MNKKHAIDQLERKKEELNSQTLDARTWINTTIQVIYSIFIDSGKQKAFFISRLKNDGYFNKEEAKKYLDEYITEIKTNGIEKASKLGFFAYWGVWSAIVGGAFGLGLYFGQSKFDKEKGDYYEQNIVLKDSISNIHKENRLLKAK
jgi:hypothetical protein